MEEKKIEWFKMWSEGGPLPKDDIYITVLTHSGHNGRFHFLSLHWGALQGLSYCGRGSFDGGGELFGAAMLRGPLGRGGRGEKFYLWSYTECVEDDLLSSVKIDDLSNKLNHFYEEKEADIEKFVELLRN